jgi:4a-hydroxytetrahydrobiopterin dehydratase
MNTADIENCVASLPSGWSVEGSELCKLFTFNGFSQAWKFMCEIAAYAESVNHHPDWRNVYNRVWVRLSTHDAGGITERDFDLARAMEQASEAANTLP